MQPRRLSASIPRGRRPQAAWLRLRDHYAAVWLSVTLGESGSAIERLYSDPERRFPARPHGGYLQPDAVTKAQKGLRALPDDVVRQASSRVVGFEAVYRHPLWQILEAIGERADFVDQTRPTRFSAGWIRRHGLDADTLGDCWTRDRFVARVTDELVQTTSQMTDLSAFALLLQDAMSPWALDACRSSWAGMLDVSWRIWWLDGLALASDETCGEAFRSIGLALSGFLLEHVPIEGDFMKELDHGEFLGPQLPIPPVPWALVRAVSASDLRRLRV